jgi:hypothetical protein
MLIINADLQNPLFIYQSLIFIQETTIRIALCQEKVNQDALNIIFKINIVQ